MNIEELLERWARWRQYRASGELGWAKRDSLGKMMSGMPGTNCPKCHGLGTHLAKKKKIRKDCDFCNGTGRIRMDNTTKANPALIRSTAPRYGYDDPESQRIDFIVCTVITEDERAVLIMEYTRIGNQNQKISRLKCTHNYYNELRQSAEAKISEQLTL